jgi:small subunit ribosomal protein S21
MKVQDMRQNQIPTPDQKLKFSTFLFIFAFRNFRTKNIPGRYTKFMLIIDSKDCENIDKALKKYKKKFEKSKVLLQLRERQSFTKPSVRRRGQVLKAIYKQKIASGKIEE